jgi:hypothetical protein
MRITTGDVGRDESEREEGCNGVVMRKRSLAFN